MKGTGKDYSLTQQELSEMIATLHEYAKRDLSADEKLFPLALYFVTTGIDCLMHKGDHVATQLEGLTTNSSSIASGLNDHVAGTVEQHGAAMDALASMAQLQRAMRAHQRAAKQADLKRQRHLITLLLALLGLSSITLVLSILLVLHWMLHT